MHLKLNGSYILYCILIILPIYQDSPLALYMGAAGYTFLGPVCFLSLGIIILTKKRIPQNTMIFKWIKLGNYLLIVTLVAILIWLMLGYPIVVVGENLLIKGIKVWLQYIVYPLYMILLLYCIRKNPSIEKMLFPIFVTYVMLSIICVIENMQLPYAFENFHFSGQFPYYRIRLLTQESSWTSLLIIIYGGMAIYYGIFLKRKIAFILSGLASVVLITLSDAKSLILVIGLAIVLYYFGTFLKRKGIIIRIITFFLLCLIFVKFAIPYLWYSISNDIANYTSIVTRVYTMFIGLLIGVIFPFGVGGSVNLGIFKYMLKRYLFVFDKLPIRFNLSEIISLSNKSTDISLTVKSGLLQFNMYWGICGTVYFFYYLQKISQEIKRSNIKCQEFLQAVFWSAIILISFASNLQFEFWMLIAVLIGMCELCQRR